MNAPGMEGYTPRRRAGSTARDLFDAADDADTISDKLMRSVDDKTVADGLLLPKACCMKQLADTLRAVATNCNKKIVGATPSKLALFFPSVGSQRRLGRWRIRPGSRCGSLVWCS